MLLEICASSYQSAVNAEKAGAARIELCTALEVGGLTPSYGLIKKVTEKLTIPVFVLIRPRSGHFCYTADELELMLENIKMCEEMGCAGIVSGVLNRDLTIDQPQTRRLIEAAGSLPFTFHRAFDWVPEPYEALETLIEMGVRRILTSGQANAALSGMEVLKNLKTKASNRLLILPGGGINADNALQFRSAGFTEIHASATRVDIVPYVGKIPMNSTRHFGENLEVHSDLAKIAAIQKAISVG